MAKLGRHKKEILEAIDLQEWHKFQKTLALNEVVAVSEMQVMTVEEYING